MADRNAAEIYAHHRRLAEAQDPDSAFAKAMEAMRSSLSEAYPHLAMHDNLLEGVVQAEAYASWRKRRCFDHFGIEAGARTPDDKAGWTLCFYSSPDESIAPVTRVTLTGAEYDELLENMQRARGVRGHE